MKEDNSFWLITITLIIIILQLHEIIDLLEQLI